MSFVRRAYLKHCLTMRSRSQRVFADKSVSVMYWLNAQKFHSPNEFAERTSFVSA